MLQINCEKELQQAKAFAVGISDDLLKQLESQLEYLAGYANGPGCRYDKSTGADTRCRLYKDFAPHSFRFEVDCKENYAAPWEYWFNGGLIYQGPDCPADGSFPSLTVSVDSKRIGWFVHT